MPTVIRVRPGEIHLYPGEPTRFVVDPAGPVIRDLDRRMTRAQAVARRLVRVRTGTLKSTIRKQPHLSATFVWVDLVAGGRGARYVMIEHDGSRPHLIETKWRGRGGRRTKKALRFTIGGRVIFRQYVKHPGTRGSRFLVLALPAAGPD